MCSRNCLRWMCKCGFEQSSFRRICPWPPFWRLRCSSSMPNSGNKHIFQRSSEQFQPIRLFIMLYSNWRALDIYRIIILLCQSDYFSNFINKCRWAYPMIQCRNIFNWKDYSKALPFQFFLAVLQIQFSSMSPY